MAEDSKNYKDLLKQIGELRSQIDDLKEAENKSQVAEKKLAEHERLLVNVFASVKDGISILDKDFTIISVNPTIEMWNPQNMPLVGKKCYKAFSDRDRVCEVCPTVQTLKSGQPAHEYVPYHDPEGVVRGWLDLFSFPLIDQETGAMKGVIEYVRDITDQKKVEDALRESEEKYRTLVEHANDGIAIIQDYRVMFLNRRLADMYGDTPDQIIGRMFVDFVHPSAMPKLVEHYDRRMAGKTIENIYETTLKMKTGDPVEVEINARVITFNGKPADLVIVRDISERRNAETAMKQQSDLINRMMETSPVGITMSNPQGQIVFANSQAEHIFGLKKDEINQRSYNDPAWKITDFHGNPVLDDNLPFTRVMKTKKPVNDVRHAIQHPDGRQVMLSINAAPLLNEKSEIEAVVFTLTDITKRLKTEDSLMKSEEKFRVTAESTSDLLWEWDIPNKRLDWFGDIDGALGYQPGEFPRTIDAWESAVHPDDHDRVMAMLERHLNDREPYHIEYRVLRKDNQISWWVDRGTALRDQKGLPYRMYGACSDITEYRKTQEALQASLVRLSQTMNGTINALANTLAKRDPYTLSHQQRVTELVIAIGQVMGLSEKQLNGIRIAATLHDIGKIYVPAEILSKPARLSDAEFKIVKTHSQAGFEILESIDFDWPVAQVVLQHHERINGTGYPAGLSDRDILFEAKILAVADVVEAMLSHRPYRAAHPQDKALEEIAEHRGQRYNAEVVDICLMLFREKQFTFKHQ